MKGIMTRRDFLSVALILMGGALSCEAKVPLDPNLVALFADTHLTTRPDNPHQRAGLARCIDEVLACNPRPAHVLFYGDLSFNHGDTNDYQLMKTMVAPLEAAGIRWHATMGNHDRRAAFLSVFPECAKEKPCVPGRLVSLIETPYADFILLDSCLEGPVNGGMDEAQRTWLQAQLSGRQKPVFVGAHHPIKETDIGGLLAASPACKGYIFGHHHTWNKSTSEGVETLCLPSTGHWGDIGYVMVKLNANEALFSLKLHDHYSPRPAATPEQAKPEWAARIKKMMGSQWRVPLALDKAQK